MNEDSIDFQPLSQDDSSKVPVRNDFRVPVSDKDNVLAILDGQTYSVANVSETGIAIYSESCLEFEAGQVLPHSELWMGTQRFIGLTGKVMHCSVHASGSLQFGICWIDLPEDKQAALNHRLKAIKTAALGRNQRFNQPQVK